MVQVLIIAESPEYGGKLRQLAGRVVDCDFVCKASLQDGIELLEGSKVSFDLILCSYSGSSVSLVKCLLDFSAGAPCIVISEAISASKQQQLAGIEALHVLDPAAVDTSLDILLRELARAGRLERSGEGEFIPFTSTALLEATPFRADVYLGAAEGRFVKLAREGEYWSFEALANAVADRQHLVFYLRSKDVSDVLRKTSQKLGALLESETLERSEAESRSEAALEIVHDVVARVGFTPEVQAIARKVAELVVRVVSEDPELSKILVRLRQNQGRYIASHSFMLAEIACAIGYKIGWNSSGTYMKLSLAAILHDITLKANAMAEVKSLRDHETLARFSPAELEEIRLHPMKAAEYAMTFHEFPPDVDLVLRQHHERPDGTGFPRGLFHRQITPLSSLFIIAHDLLDDFLGPQPEVSLDDFLARNQAGYSYGNFRKICQAIKQKTVLS